MITAIDHIAQRYPSAPMFALAFSAGAHVLTTYLAHVGKNTPLVACSNVAGCLDFVRTYDFVEKTKSGEEVRARELTWRQVKQATKWPARPTLPYLP